MTRPPGRVIYVDFTPYPRPPHRRLSRRARRVLFVGLLALAVLVALLARSC